MTWNTTSTSRTTGSRAGSLFGLDDNNKSNILVYKFRSGQKALQVSTQHDLHKALASDPDLPFIRVTKKKIPRGNSRIDVKTEDLLMPEDLERCRDKKFMLQSSMANVGLPSSAYWKRLLFDSYPELYIVSRSLTPSPASSAHNSPSSSQHVTSFPVDTPHPLQDPQA